MKLRIGIVFGGNSKEREISFAGGRTVYDNLDKNLFEAVPIFVDSFNQFIQLKWEFVYKGSIRDFYPKPGATPLSKNGFQVYAESLPEIDSNLLHEGLGEVIKAEDLPSIIDMAFLCLHGPNGEDGRIQGLFEFIGLPYTGSGILPSSIGIDKVVQKKLMKGAGFDGPTFFTLSRTEWVSKASSTLLLARIAKEIGFPCVIKSAKQGSSIGVSVLKEEDESLLEEAINKSFFIRKLKGEDWKRISEHARVELVRSLCDIREGIGLPLFSGDTTLFHPEHVLDWLNNQFSHYPNAELSLMAREGESEIILEKFIEGKEFSAIVIEDLNGNAICLPPTEIRKGNEVFDYRSKYLPGLSRKITPIHLPDSQIEFIRKECEKLYNELGFDVYARIDGFITSEGRVLLNDPNTTSGMMPSSFFFHQAAEIGLNPSQFITYIIYASLKSRIKGFGFNGKAERLLENLNESIQQKGSGSKNKRKIAVIFGGYSSERHISVESGRNIYEKLSSSSRFEPVPVFLGGNPDSYSLYAIPINLVLKDNADDIYEKILHFSRHKVISDIIEECKELTGLFGSVDNLNAPVELSFEQLAERVDEVFIALHGRPGEDGAIQEMLTKVGLPYNGSDSSSSAVTIDKYLTNEQLKKHGLLVAEHYIVDKKVWMNNPDEIYAHAETFGFPLIAKPVDDGCSSAVKKIRNINEFKAFAELIFRNQPDLENGPADILKIKPKEEFPQKERFLVEELISSNGASRFIEITGGLLTHLSPDKGLVYELFEASEALAEGEVLSLEEKFLAGQGQNITPARYADNPEERNLISHYVKEQLEKAARILNVQGYARIDAFVRIFSSTHVEVIFIEVNSLPGMTPATCIFHQSAINGYKPYEFIEKIMTFAEESSKQPH